MSENREYTAAPAFDSPEEEAKFYKEHKVEPAGNFTYSENGDYEAVPAFDSPEEAEFYKKQKEAAERNKKHDSPVFHEN